MSSSEVSDVSLNDMGSDGEMSTYSSGSELNMDLLTRTDNGTVFDPSCEKTKSQPTGPDSLLKIGAKVFAEHIPFEAIYCSHFIVPEEVQKLIAFCSFPSNEENIRLYSCLSVGGSHSFNDGVALLAKDAVRDCVQIGFFLSASVLAEASIQSTPSNFTPIHRVSLMFDRTCITSCSCTCTVEVEGISQQQQSLNQRSDLQNDSYLHTTSASLPKQQVADSGVWCAHVVATCLKRIRSPGSVIYRPPISESLSKLNKNELQLFAQQLICHVGARKILPAAQSILDDILLPHTSPVKGFVEGQDPTAGGLIGESSSWRFDISTLEEKLRNTLVRFSKTKSPFHGDLSSINSCLSHHSEEMICILRSLRTYEPRGVWALLAVIVGMLRKKDLNALPILQMFTRCILDVDEIMFWWYVVQLNVDMQVRLSRVGKRKQSCYGAAWLCEALVDVWRLVCLDPKLREKGSPRKRFISKLSNWHQAAIIKAQRGMRVAQFSTSAGSALLVGSPENLRNLFSENSQKLFVGFKPAIQACQISWSTEMPPTHALTKEQFIQALPHFDGAFVAEYSTGVEMWNESFDSHDTTGCQSYPSMRGQFGTNFARCQSLVMHDDTDASLAWVRHLALEMLLSAPSFVAAARSAALQNLETAAQIDPLTESLKHVERITCLNSSTGSARRYRRTVTATAMNTSVGASSVMTTATTSRRGGGGGNSLRRTTSNVAPQRSSEVEQLAKLWADFYVSEVAEFSITFTEWVYCVEYLMDCLYSLHYNEGLVYPPALSNQHLTHPSAQGGDSSVGVYHSPSSATSLPSGTGASSGTTADSAAEWFSLDIELGFRLGLLTLALPRPQHTVAAMEVRLFDHEASLLSRLYRLPLEFACPWVIESVRREAQLLGDGVNRFGDCSAAYVPYSLSEFLFQMLAGSDPLPPSNTLPPPPPPPPISVAEDGGEGENSSSRSAYAVSDNATAGGSNVTPSTTQTPTAVVCLPLALRIQQHGGNFDPDPSASTSRTHETRDDSELAFGLARHIFGQRTRIPEKVAPMFVECQRSQMQSFVLRILRYYKDDPRRISDLAESLLDPSLNSSFKPPPLWFCLSASLEEMMQFRFENEEQSVIGNGTGYSDSTLIDTEITAAAGGAPEPVVLSSLLEEVVGIDKQNCNSGVYSGDTAIANSSSPLQDTSVSFSCVENKNHQASSERAATSTGEDTDTLSDSKAWDKRLRCATLRDPRRINRHSVGMAAVDSSAPETTSSDNSPTTSRGTFLFRLPKGMTSGAAFVTSGGSTSVARRRNGDSSSDCLSSSTGEESRSTAGASSSNRAAGYSRGTISDDMRCTIPRQRPTESYAQHIFQLAKSIRIAAGGPNASVSVFNPEAVTHGPTNRNLHFAAVLVGLYALGLVNQQQPSWKSRTYSRHVAWISQQIFEIELPAAFMLLHSWRNHFTTEEVTAVAYQLFEKGNQRLSKMAGELCLASLTDCTTLNSDAIKCALSQLSAMPEMLERGLLCIEEGVKSAPFGVVSELHFQLASYWFRLYEITKGKLSRRSASAEAASGTAMVPAVENQPSNTDGAVWSSGFQEPVHPFIPELVYIPTNNINPIAATATPAGSAFVPSFAQPFSLPFYPVFPVQPSQQVSVSLPPMQQLTMQSVAPSIYEFYPGHPHLYPTATPTPLPQITAPINQDDIEDYLRRALFSESAMTSEPSASVPAATDANAEVANTANVDAPPLGQENETVEHNVVETQVEPSAVVESLIDPIIVKRAEGSVVRELEGKARHFLLRSFRSFLCGIEKLFSLQTPHLGSTPLQSRDWSGKFCHCQHRHHHLDGENVSTLFQNESLSNRVSLTNTRGDDYAPWNVDGRPWAGCTESPSSSEENILRALEVAEMLGDEAVSIYCRRMIKCIPCPLIMSAITVKVLDKYFPNRLSSSTASSSSVYSQCSPGRGYPFASSGTPYHMAHQRPLVWSYPQWEAKYMLQQQQQQTVAIPAVVGNPTNNEIASNALNKELLEQMVNRIHYLFHVQINLHLRSLGRSQEGWGEFVDMVLSAYLANQRMPPTNQTLTWECLFRRIEQYSRNTPALLERVVTCIETINMRFPPPSITAAFAAATGFNGVHVAISIPSSGAPPPPPPPPHSSS